MDRTVIGFALEKLTEEERELILLRYVNEVPISVICKLQKCSRFALYRKINKILKKLKQDIGENNERSSL